MTRKNDLRNQYLLAVISHIKVQEAVE